MDDLFNKCMHCFSSIQSGCFKLQYQDTYCGGGGNSENATEELENGKTPGIPSEQMWLL